MVMDTAPNAVSGATTFTLPGLASLINEICCY